MSMAGATAAPVRNAELLIPRSRCQSSGGVGIPHTFPGVSSSTPTWHSSRELCGEKTERTRARTGRELAPSVPVI